MFVHIDYLDNPGVLTPAEVNRTGIALGQNISGNSQLYTPPENETNATNVTSTKPNVTTTITNRTNQSNVSLPLPTNQTVGTATLNTTTTTTTVINNQTTGGVPSSNVTNTTVTSTQVAVAPEFTYTPVE